MVALPLGSREHFEPLLAAIGEARFVLIGEASHGTHEFYRARAEITKRLLAEREFVAVAIDGDWPDAWRVNRYVRGRSEDRDASEALAGFRRFPTWMWRNTDVLDFVGWLRAYNEGKGDRAAGFYGLDLYSLHASMEAVLGYLDTVDAAAARRARERYACFDHFGEDVRAGLRLTAAPRTTPPGTDGWRRTIISRPSRGAQPGPARAGATPGRDLPRRLQHAYRHGDGGHGLGSAGGAQARQAFATGKLRAAFPRDRAGAVLAPRTGEDPRAATPPPAKGHRCHLPARHGAAQPLFRGSARSAVRRRPP
jgi:hypothetical protein